MHSMVGTTWIFRPSKLHRKRYVETTWIFRPAKLRRKKYVEMTWKFVEIFSSMYRRGFDVVCPLVNHNVQ